MIFQAGNVHESATLFNVKEKKNDLKDGSFRANYLDSPVYYTNH